MPKRPELRQVAVTKRRQQRHRGRKEHLLPLANDLEAAEREHVVEVRQRQPVLVQALIGDVQARGHPKRQRPQPAIKVDDDARRWRTHRRDPLDSFSHVPQIVNQVREDDVVELAIQTKLIGVALNEMELRVALGSALEHLGRKIDPDAQRRLDRRQQAPVPDPSSSTRLCGGMR